MKYVLLVLVAASLAACSSKKKEAEENTAAPVIEEKATTAKEKAANAKGKAKAKIAEAKQEAQEEPTSTSSDASFPSYDGTEKSSFACKNGGDSRKISVLSGSEGGCGVVYNKFGEAKTVAVAKSSMDHCDNVASKIKGNLESAGFDCGEGSSAAAAPAATSAPAQKDLGQPTSN